MEKDKQNQSGSESQQVTPSQLLESWILSLHSQGMSPRKISASLGIPLPQVSLVIAGKIDEIADSSAKVAKELLPELMRQGAMYLLSVALRPDKVEKASTKDLAIAAGILIDKGLVMEQGGALNHVSVLVQLQGRADREFQDELRALLAGRAQAPIEIAQPAQDPETVEPIPVYNAPAATVQPCPEKSSDNCAPIKPPKPPRRHPLGKLPSGLVS